MMERPPTTNEAKPNRESRRYGPARHASSKWRLNWATLADSSTQIGREFFAAQVWGAIKNYFDDTHELRCGSSARGEKAEIASLRSTVTGVMRKPPQETVPAGTEAPPNIAVTGNRQVFFNEAGEFVDTPTFARDTLLT